ncbi:TPR-like protein [Durotheca rogersii]|uniref:TPR-like protein n=1 Tax=Durotheca rogersii TaxID=419775 RepID=UPI00221F4FC8|nr:TPR-like protein [Durotheca rogersii]KAI5863200.1 TPR-like protein [Durotheca rogersii]
MSHPFSSTFDVLQAHFTHQRDSQPGHGVREKTQDHDAEIHTHNPPGSLTPQRRHISGFELPQNPGDLARDRQLDIEPNHMPAPLPRRGDRAPNAASSAAPTQRKPLPILQPCSRNGRQAVAPTSDSGAVQSEPWPRTLEPPTVLPDPAHPSIGTPYGREAGLEETIPLYGSTSTTMTRGEAPPTDSTTDALLERQNDLSMGHPLPSLPHGRGLSGKYFGNGDKPRRSGRGDRGGRVTKKRGPRKAAEPTGDIKYRLNMASNAYMDGRLDDAIEFVEDAIRINAETYRAWVLLASFLQEKGDKKGHFTARVYAAHLQPKIIDGWLQCAEIGIGLRDEFPEEADAFLEQSIFCYSSALRADTTHRPARHGRAALYFEMGRVRSAAKDYAFLVERCYFDVYALRGLAEISVLLADTGKPQFADRPREAMVAYRRCISHFRNNGFDSRYPFEWQDIRIFVDLLVHLEWYGDAVYELKSLSRWLLARSDEAFWDGEDDDREWDITNTRRLEVGGYRDGEHPASSYGGGLPLELRTKLAVCRLKLGREDEAMRHIQLIDPDSSNLSEVASEHPHILLEIASALYEAGHLRRALRYYEPLRASDLLDTESLVRTGRCYLEIGDKRLAEECFTLAIDLDESNSDACIDARYELAKMYEAAREEKEAYILVNEAIRLQEAREWAHEDGLEDDNEDGEGDDIGSSTMSQVLEAGRESGARSKQRPLMPKVEKPNSRAKPSELRFRADARLYPTRRRRKVFARTEELQMEDKRRAKELEEAWEVVRTSRALSDANAEGPSGVFMSAAQELVDDFRSYKEFYSWDRYLAHLGIDQARQKVVARNPNLLAMAERLSHNLNPESAGAERPVAQQVAISYRGVPFDEWLDLFLECALGLAQTGKFQDAYKVCESARDATIFSKSKESMFLIHVTWAACALRGRDEETCVASARWLMREYQFDTDPFRLFSALSRLCPSPASWYASGPVQKYMLRQIKLMDRAMTAGGAEDSGDEEGAPSGRVYAGKELDITLLMLYGHVLFISNSFTYALNYFLRAYSLDPSNGMVILSVGHCYVHYALKRQSENRQYLLVQGFLFLHRYYDIKQASASAAQRQEAHYNLARSYHAVGIPHIAAEFYRRALRDVPDEGGDGGSGGIMGSNDVSREAAYNLQQICWAGGDIEAVRAIAEEHLVL